MGNQAKVTSIDALDAFRASLIIFVTKARRSLDDVRDELRRTGLWLEHDQRLHWDREVERRTKILNQAQQELTSARLSQLQDSIQVQQLAVVKARRVLEGAQAKRVKVRAWNRDYESLADPLGKKLEGFRYVLDQDMPKAIAYLVGAIRTLEGYAELHSGPAEAPPPGEAELVAEPAASPDRAE